MVSSKNCVLASVAAIALSASTANAHGELTQPKPTFKGYGGGVSATIESSTLTVPAGMSFSAGPDTNAEAFDKAFKAAGKTSLKDFILKNQNTAGATSPVLSAECGFSDPSGTPQPLPDKIQWGTSFIHPGPCEAWCDDENVVPYTANCWKTFADGSVPYTKAKCTGKKRLTFYWLALHSPPWQVYINCVPLSGASSGGSAATTPTVTTKAPATGTTPAATTKAPAATTKTPAATTKTPVASDATSAPAATTTAPGKKCKRKLEKVVEE